MRWPNRLTGGAARDLEFRLDSRVRSTWPAFSHVRYLSPVGFQVDLKKKENLPFFSGDLSREKSEKREEQTDIHFENFTKHPCWPLSLRLFLKKP